MALQGKVVIITGGAKNLGGLIAEQFASSGAQLAIHYNSPASREAADKLVAKLKSASDIKVELFQADLTSVSNVKQFFDNVEKVFPQIDIVINTVGKVLKKPLTEISEKEFDEMFAVNTKSAFFITQEAAKRVKDGGKIINTVTSLLAAYTGFYSTYQGSKAPVEWFTKGLSKELMGRGISVNAVAPGPMDTRMYKALVYTPLLMSEAFFYGQETSDAVAFHKSNAIGGRLTSIEDIAPIYKFLCTDGAWINGQVSIQKMIEMALTRSDRFCLQMVATLPAKIRWDPSFGFQTKKTRCCLGKSYLRCQIVV